MGMKNLTTGGFGNQGAPRQGLLGTLWAYILEYEVKQTKDGADYIDGKLIVSGSEHYTYFNVFASKNKPNLVEEFCEAFPQFEMEGYLLCAPRQRKVEKEAKNGSGKKYNDFVTSLKVFGWKDEFDEKRDGFLTGTLLYQDTRDTYYREPKDNSSSFAQLATKAVSSFGEEEIVLQAFGDDADRAYEVLADDGVEQDTALFVRALPSGGRLSLVSVEKSKASTVARTPEEAAELANQKSADAEATEKARPRFGGAGKGTTPGANKSAPAANKPKFGGAKGGGAAKPAQGQSKPTTPWKSKK